MINHAQYEIVDVKPTLVLIKDIGPWSVYKTVTNDAEWVVKQVYNEFGDRRIDYIDSDGNRDQLVHTRGTFTGFAPGAMY